MFVQPGNTITYSLYVPESLVSGLSRAEVIDRLVETFRSRYGLTDGSASADGSLDVRTLDIARDRVVTKFGTDEWLYRVP